jgi:YD repeat-containing protein
VYPWITRSLLGLLLALGSLTAHAGSGTRTAAFAYDAAGLLIKDVIEPSDPTLCLVTEHGYDVYGNKTTVTTRNCAGQGINSLVNEAAAPAGDAAFTSRTSYTSFNAGAGTNGVTLSYPAGLFPTTSTNAIAAPGAANAHTETKQYDPRFGVLTKLTGPNNLDTTWVYDEFGRKIQENRADGTRTRWEYAMCQGAGITCPTPTQGGVTLVYRVKAITERSDNGAQLSGAAYAYYDMLTREIFTETEGTDGAVNKIIRTQKQYDTLSRVTAVSKPYFDGASILWTTYTYDGMGRVLTETAPATDIGTLKTTTTYTATSHLDMRVTVEISNNGAGSSLPQGVTQSKTTYTNVLGQTTKVVDVQSGWVTYLYDAFGNLRRTDTNNQLTWITYDLRGRKITMADPNMGNWNYAYNPLGELKRQTDAKGNTTTMVYDVLGRMTQRNEPDLISKWFYDAYPTTQTAPPDNIWASSMLPINPGVNGDCSKGKGKLCYVWTDHDYRRLHTYEAGGAGRPLVTVTRIGTDDHVVTNTYEAGTGRLDTVTYPTGQQAKRVYHATQGYLQKVTNNLTGASLVNYWELLTVNASGRITSEKTGNGVITNRTYDQLERTRTIQAGPGGAPTSIQNNTYTYDTIGNMTQRTDALAAGGATTENFVYDTLNRLLTRSGTGPGIPTAGAPESVSYDVRGNISTKTGVGTYGYWGCAPLPTPVTTCSNP